MQRRETYCALFEHLYDGVQSPEIRAILFHCDVQGPAAANATAGLTLSPLGCLDRGSGKEALAAQPFCRMEEEVLICGELSPE